MRVSCTLTKRAQYALVYQQGSTYIDSLIVMKALPNGLSSSRYGFSVTKKVGKAVERNRLKRLLREVIHLRLVKPGWDIVFVVRQEAVNADYHQLEKAVIKLLTQAGLITKDDETASAKVN